MIAGQPDSLRCEITKGELALDAASVSTLSTLLGIVVALVPLGACAYVMWRSQSFHPLTYRLRRLVYGDQEVHDPDIKQMLAEQYDRMLFRHEFGIPVASMAQLRRVKAWATEQQVEMPELGACRGYFRLRRKAVELLRPSRWSLAWLVPSALLGVVLFFFASELLASVAVFYTFKESGRHFSMTETAARPLLPEGPALTVEDCLNLAIGKPGAVQLHGRAFGEFDRASVCEAFIGDGSEAGKAKAAQRLRADLNEARARQRGLGFVLALASIVWGWVAVAGLFAWTSARDLRRRLDDADTQEGGSAPVLAT